MKIKNRPDNTWLIVSLLCLSAILSASTPYDVSHDPVPTVKADRWICPHCRCLNSGNCGWCDQCGLHHSIKQRTQETNDDDLVPYRDEWDEWPY